MDTRWLLVLLLFIDLYDTRIINHDEGLDNINTNNLQESKRDAGDKDINQSDNRFKSVSDTKINIPVAKQKTKREKEDEHLKNALKMMTNDAKSIRKYDWTNFLKSKSYRNYLKRTVDLYNRSLKLKDRDTEATEITDSPITQQQVATPDTEQHTTTNQQTTTERQHVDEPRNEENKSPKQHSTYDYPEVDILEVSNEETETESEQMRSNEKSNDLPDKSSSSSTTGKALAYHQDDIVDEKVENDYIYEYYDYEDHSHDPTYTKTENERSTDYSKPKDYAYKPDRDYPKAFGVAGYGVYRDIRKGLVTILNMRGHTSLGGGRYHESHEDLADHQTIYEERYVESNEDHDSDDPDEDSSHEEIYEESNGHSDLDEYHGDSLSEGRHEESNKKHESSKNDESKTKGSQDNYDDNHDSSTGRHEENRRQISHHKDNDDDDDETSTKSTIPGENVYNGPVYTDYYDYNSEDKIGTENTDSSAYDNRNNYQYYEYNDYDYATDYDTNDNDKDSAVKIKEISEEDDDESEKRSFKSEETDHNLTEDNTIDRTVDTLSPSDASGEDKLDNFVDYENIQTEDTIRREAKDPSRGTETVSKQQHPSTPQSGGDGRVLVSDIADGLNYQIDLEANHYDGNFPVNVYQRPATEADFLASDYYDLYNDYLLQSLEPTDSDRQIVDYEYGSYDEETSIQKEDDLINNKEEDITGAF